MTRVARHHLLSKPGRGTSVFGRMGSPTQNEIPPGLDMSEETARDDVAAWETLAIERPPCVHIYSDSFSPEPNTHGAGLAICSQVQAFLDIGCEVEYVFIRTRDNVPSSPGYFKEIVCTVVDARNEHPTRSARLAYWAGWPRELAWRQLYPARNVLLREAKARFQSHRSAIHVFNFMRTANVIPSLRKARTIYACHEINCDYKARCFALNQEVEKRRPHSWEKRELRRTLELERNAARSSGLVLCVAPEDAKRIAEEWQASQTAYLPMSIANGDKPVVARERRKDGILRLLHIGDLSHLPSFTSLEFLFTKVFPLLGADTISRLQLEVAGKAEAVDRRAMAILEMARSYPMAHFSGFVDDIRSAYSRNDLQLVASTQATGIRTRIIESWAFGMPVLSTTVGAGGVGYLAPGRNILIADDPRDFARNLRELIHAPERLDEIAISARKTYEAKHSRQAVASALRKLLSQYFGVADGPS